VRSLKQFALSDAEWEDFKIPINVAFIFQSSAENRIVALYPSPAGATESQLSIETWNALANENPALKDMEADVEALLVNRLDKHEYYILPIDECFRLVGIIRTHWHGFSGGTEVWHEIEKFFAKLRTIGE
jgi:hypothetical protein